jgi:hypothetical protein
LVKQLEQDIADGKLEALAEEAINSDDRVKRYK